MELLSKELNVTDNKIASTISYNFCQNKDSLVILKKYEINVLYEVIDKIKEYQDELYTELVKRYNNGSEEIENLKVGFNIINKCITEIKYIINKKEEEETHQIIQNKKNLIILTVIRNYFSILCILCIIIIISFHFIY